VLDALGLDAAVVAAPLEVYDNGPKHLIVTVEGEATVRGLRPDYGRLARAAPAAGTSVCAVTGPTSAATRMFFPAGGIVEDPATGSAAGPVGVHLLRHGLVEPGAELTLSQGAEILRPSTLLVRIEGLADAIAGVAVGGTAVVVGTAVFDLPASS
jgi:trans-2,3-dihydro-3-hydroxyanthranilate isomerase